MGKAKMRITDAFLLDALSLPWDTVISNCWMEDRFTLALEVNHSDIPDGVDEVEPRFLRQKEVVFLGWVRDDTL